MSDNLAAWKACIKELRQLLGPIQSKRIINIIVHHLGGMTIHIPSTKTLYIEARAEQIKNDYWARAMSFNALKLKYSLSIKQLKRIVYQKKGHDP